MTGRVGFQDLGLSVVLAIQATIMFVVAPLAETRLISPVAVEVARFGLATAAVVLVTRRRLVALAIAATFGLSFLLPLVSRMESGGAGLTAARMAVTTLFDLAVAVAVAHVAFGPGRVSVHRIMGALILYLSIALIFANAYRACDLFLAPAFSGLPQGRNAPLGQLLYFSLTTLTTTGYGDITPLHPFVRSLANLEAVIGQIFPATLLARLVTLHAAEPPGGR
jgi:hypothetical protein